MTKEDYIGTTWKCPRCNVEVEVTEQGLSHQCAINGKFWALMSLSTYFEYQKSYDQFRKEMKSIERKMLYGSEE